MTTQPMWSVRTSWDEPAHVWDWADGDPPVHALLSVRSPLSHARSRHIPVRAYSATTGSVLPLESGLEHDLLRVLDRDPAVVWLVSQPCRWSFVTDTGVTRHIPDLLSQDASGGVTVWDVRPLERHDEKFASVVELSRAACAAVGWTHRVFTGCGEVERLNLLWLHGFRALRPWHAARSWTILSHLQAEPERQVVLEEIFDLDDGTGELVSTAWHLIWSGRLATDLSVPLTPGTHVALAREVRSGA